MYMREIKLKSGRDEVEYQKTFGVPKDLLEYQKTKKGWKMGGCLEE